MVSTLRRWISEFFAPVPEGPWHQTIDSLTGLSRYDEPPHLAPEQRATLRVLGEAVAADPDDSRARLELARALTIIMEDDPLELPVAAILADGSVAAVGIYPFGVLSYFPAGQVVDLRWTTEK